LKKQLEIGLIVELSLKYIILYFYIPKKEQIWLYKVEPVYNKEQDTITINVWIKKDNEWEVVFLTNKILVRTKDSRLVSFQF